MPLPCDRGRSGAVLTVGTKRMEYHGADPGSSVSKYAEAQYLFMLEFAS